MSPQNRIQSIDKAQRIRLLTACGLQRAQNTRSTSRLGPVPIIGDLLGSRRREQTRTDLVFFLRPTIIANTGDAAAQATIERNLQQEDIRRALGQPPATPQR